MTDPLADSIPLDEIDVRPPAFTDDALGLSFAEKHEDELRYVAAWSKWLIYDGTRWAIDDTMRAFDLSRLICRAASAECNVKKTADAVASAKTVAAVERLAKADRRHAAITEQWDSDDLLLNTMIGEADDR